ncbi:MAG: hypothetical protein QHJ73_09255, partial [Armatimonadota bacterium]|nr:hypothetical protein [Armatimonadota bacterium]
MKAPADEVEARVRSALQRAGDAVVTTPAREVYLDLAESVSRQAARWQQPDGMIADPVGGAGREVPTTTARYTAAVGHLVRARRCLDLLESGARAMDWCCTQLVEHWRRGEVWHGAEFCVKDMMAFYEAARPLVGAERFARWSDCLKAPPPEAIYRGGHNWVFYATAAEVLRIRNALSDRHDYVDRALEGEMPNWTAWGMYRDPGDPVTYDLTVRQSLAMMLEHGYRGAYAQWARKVLRQGALTTLLFVSPAGTAPYGGRSNQFHHMEGMIAYLCEWQAK